MGINPFNEDGDSLLCDVQPYKSDTLCNKNALYLKKYRPRKISDIYLPLPLRQKIDGLVNIPNMLITGPPGTGKTTTIKQLAKKIYGKYYNDAVIELNASDNRGLETINNSIIYFCRKKLNDHEGNPITKLVIMDEADNITKKAQNMISNFMEEYNNNTNFVFTCNDSNKLIESIQSRCFIIFFPSIKKAMIVDKLEHICRQEGIEYEVAALEQIATNSNGDMRQAVLVLDMICHGMSRCTLANVELLNHQPQQKVVMELIKACAQRNLKEGVRLIKTLKADGYCGSDIILSILNVVNRVNIDEGIRLKYIKHISESYINISNGIDSNLQMYGCLSKLVLS